MSEITNREEMTLDSDVFEQARKAFDTMLQKLFRSMSNSKSDQGSITLKVDVSMNKIDITDSDGTVRVGDSPSFKHTITTQVPVKDSIGGSSNMNMEMVFDEESGTYILRHAPVDGQMTIFDQMEEVHQEAEDVTGQALPGPSNAIEDKFMNPPVDDDYAYDEPEV